MAEIDLAAALWRDQEETETARLTEEDEDGSRLIEYLSDGLIGLALALEYESPQELHIQQGIDTLLHIHISLTVDKWSAPLWVERINSALTDKPTLRADEKIADMIDKRIDAESLIKAGLISEDYLGLLRKLGDTVVHELKEAMEPFHLLDPKELDDYKPDTTEIVKAYRSLLGQMFDGMGFGFLVDHETLKRLIDEAFSFAKAKQIMTLQRSGRASFDDETLLRSSELLGSDRLGQIIGKLKLLGNILGAKEDD